jgi:DNA-binding transcriptional regulator YiaG
MTQHATDNAITTDALRALRKSNQWSTGDMARAVGDVKPRTVEHWMQGRAPHKAYHARLKALLRKHG